MSNSLSEDEAELLDYLVMAQDALESGNVGDVGKYVGRASLKIEEMEE